MSLYAHIEQLEMIREQLERLAQRAACCADAFNGSEFTKTAHDRDSKLIAPGLNSRFADNIVGIQQLVGTLADQLNRIESEVLDQSIQTSGISMSKSTSMRDF